MTTPFAEIGADAADKEQLMRDVDRNVRANETAGAYDDAALHEADKMQIRALPDDAEALSRVIAHLRESAAIDIGDFPIVNTGGPFGRLEVLVKRTIWKLMRFYTYRMFTQQREFNMQVVAVLEALWRREKSRGRNPERQNGDGRRAADGAT
ncbi:MAG: hypothetical protein FJ225_10685 [Lentisphaerae bacterium]|nr:hypothetical protein [Lentisphaerota bacterium]